MAVAQASVRESAVSSFDCAARSAAGTMTSSPPKTYTADRTEAVVETRRPCLRAKFGVWHNVNGSDGKGNNALFLTNRAAVSYATDISVDATHFVLCVEG